MSLDFNRDEQDRKRSPRFPYIDLAESITRIEEIYRKERRAATTPDVLVTHLGYKQKHGKSARVLGALKQFGLLEEKEGLYRVSDLGFRLLNLPEDSGERASIVKHLAMQPPVIQEVMRAYPDGLPSDATLKSYLVLNAGFNPESAALFTRVLRQTLTFAGINAEEFIQGEVEESRDKGSESLALQPFGTLPNSFWDKADGTFTTRQNVPVNPVSSSSNTPPKNAEVQNENVLVFRISQNSNARIIFDGKVTQEAIKKLIKLLDISMDTFPNESTSLIQSQENTGRENRLDETVSGGRYIVEDQVVNAHGEPIEE
jgi:hypothetical protein